MSKKKQLGKILLQQKLVSQEELNTLLSEQSDEPGHRLASIAARAGAVDEGALLKALSEQLGLPGIDLAQVVVPLENLDLIPVEIAKQHVILPILVKPDRIFLAMADPKNRRAIDEIEFVAGRKVFPYVALHDPLVDTIERSYELARQGEKHFIGDDVPEDYLASLGLTKPKKAQKPEAAPDVFEAFNDGGVVPADMLGSGTHDPFASQVAPLPTERESREVKAPEETTIMVVDDESDIRKLLSRVLMQRRYQVVSASRGQEALDIVAASPPDLILLDAMLPEVHGFEICRRLKSDKRYADIPIIVVSAIYRGWRVAEDLKSSYGVDAFLEKPFKIGDVLELVEAALAGQELKKSADTLGEEASKFLADGMAAYEAGDLEKAIEKLRDGVQANPMSFPLHYHLGLLAGRGDNLFEAIHSMEAAVDLEPRNFSALKNLAILYQKAGFRHNAVGMWERALAAADDDATKATLKEHLLSLL